MYEPRMEKASSSSAAAFTLALSSGRNDSFSSKAKVVPEVMLLPSRLGGFVPKSELESARSDVSSEGVWLLPALADLSAMPARDPFTTRLGGGLISSLRSLRPATILVSARCSALVVCSVSGGQPGLAGSLAEAVVGTGADEGAAVRPSSSLPSRTAAIPGALATVAVAGDLEALWVDAAATLTEGMGLSAGIRQKKEEEQGEPTLANDILPTSFATEGTAAMVAAGGVPGDTERRPYKIRPEEARLKRLGASQSGKTLMGSVSSGTSERASGEVEPNQSAAVSGAGRTATVPTGNQETKRSRAVQAEGRAQVIIVRRG